MTLIVMYFNNSLTIWNTEMNAIDKEKNISDRLVERARGSCKEENMTCKAAKSSRVMHWTRQSNKMNNPNNSKMKGISVCLYWTLISHYWSLFSSYYRIVYAQIFCRTFTILSILQIRCRTVLTLVSLSLICCNSLSVVASSWLSCRRFKAMSLVGIYP